MPGNFTFFTTQIENDVAIFGENETKHALVSLRYNVGDEISFTNGNGSNFRGSITKAEKKCFEAKIISEEKSNEPPKLTVVCGIIKSGDRLEWMVEKCTELGVASLLFVKCTNSERGTVNIEKLNKTAIAALKQSHGCWLPKVEEISWKSAMQLPGEKILAAITGTTFTPEKLSFVDVCLIGPEGDFAPAELEQAVAAGFQPFSLGERILRTETAVVALAAFFALR